MFTVLSGSEVNLTPCLDPSQQRRGDPWWMGYRKSGAFPEGSEDSKAGLKALFSFTVDLSLLITACLQWKQLAYMLTQDCVQLVIPQERECWGSEDGGKGWQGRAGLMRDGQTDRQVMTIIQRLGFPWLVSHS